MNSNETQVVREDLVETVEVACRLCGSRRYKHLFSADNLRRKTKRFFNVVECNDCGFRYINPAPTNESLKYYYEEYEAHIPRRINRVESLYYHFFRSPQRAVPPGKLLDIGCGNGKYLSFMYSNGWDVTGVDKDAGCIFPRDVLGFKLLDGEIWNHKIPDATYDLITIWWVIEHVTDPHKLLAECARILKPGGELIVSTINSDALEAKIFKRYWWHLLVPEHISQFNVKTLTSLINGHGFSIFKLRHEPATCGFIGSFQNYFDDKKIKINVNNIFFKVLFLPVDILFSLLQSSGLVTVHATKQ